MRECWATSGKRGEVFARLRPPRGPPLSMLHREGMRRAPCPPPPGYGGPEWVTEAEWRADPHLPDVGWGAAERGDGTWTADRGELDRLVRAAWDPVFRRYADAPEPDWEGPGGFFERYGRYVGSHPCELPDLGAPEGWRELRRTASRWSPRQAGGVDGWRPAEVKALPEPFWRLLAQLLVVVEREHRWPDAILDALISLLPKGEGAGPLQQRPITVMCLLYRVWASTRMRHVLRWQERWARPGQGAYRPGRCTEDLYWRVALRLEHAALSGDPAAGATFDYRKCFDMFPWPLVTRLFSITGLEDRVIRPMRAMWGSLRRRFRIAGGVGSAFLATNGGLQGDALAALACNAVIAVWDTAVGAECPGAEPN
eukprot:gene58290-biopygen26341